MKDKLEFLRRPWAITREAFEVLAGYDFDRCEASPVLAEVRLEDFEEKLNLTEYSGVAILDIDGPLMQSPSLMARYFLGAVDLVRVEQLIRMAQAQSSVRALAIRMNTPGGTVAGTPEAGNAVADFVASGKPLYVFSRGTVASAGYWIAAPATEIVGTESSRWGSVGAVRPHIDLSEAHKQSGIKVELFTSGKHKAAGAMNTSLTNEQRDFIQSEIMLLGEKFRTHVAAHRDGIDRDDMEAQVFYADEALTKGYIDRVVPNFEEFIAEVIEQQGSRYAPRAGARVDTMRSDKEKGDLAEPNMKKEDTTETEEKLEGDAPVDGATDTQTDGEGATDGATSAGGEGAEGADTTAQDESPGEIALTDAQLAALEAKLETKIEAKLMAQFDAKVEAKAAEQAARIAAESATDAADVTGQGDSLAADESRFASLSETELWSEYDKIRAEKGDNAARAFYRKHIEVE